MGILEADRVIDALKRAKSARDGAEQYARKLSLALEVLREFDSKDVDDIEGAKASCEKAGRMCVILITAEGYQCLIDENGKLIASSIVDNTE